MNPIQHLILIVSHAFSPAAQQNPLPLMVVGAFAVLNMAMYFFTRGKEFAIGGFASALFLVPFVQL